MTFLCTFWFVSLLWICSKPFQLILKKMKDFCCKRLKFIYANFCVDRIIFSLSGSLLNFQPSYIIQSMLDKRTSDKRTHRISEPFFISQYQFPNFLHCKTNKHRISEPRISEPHRINEPFFISQRYPNSYLSERFKKKNKKNTRKLPFL